jgi:hypothetical protein
VFVAHDPEDLERYRPRALEVARFCERWGMRYEEKLGSDRLINRLVHFASDPTSADAEFLVISPGGSIEQMDFLDV